MRIGLFSECFKFVTSQWLLLNMHAVLYKYIYVLDDLNSPACAFREFVSFVLSFMYILKHYVFGPEASFSHP